MLSEGPVIIRHIVSLSDNHCSGFTLKLLGCHLPIKWPKNLCLVVKKKKEDNNNIYLNTITQTNPSFL